MPCRTLGKIPGISWTTPAGTCICATRSCCVSTWMTVLATNGLDVEAKQPGPLAHLTWHIWISISGVHGNSGVWDSWGDPTGSCGRIQIAARVIHDTPEIFPRFRHDIIRRYTKCIKVGGGHIVHLLFWIKWYLQIVFQLYPLLLS